MASTETADNSSKNDAQKQASSPPSLPPRRVFVPRANCTHITVDLLYSKTTPCDICGRVSRLGWLYQCQQDAMVDATARRQILTVSELKKAETLLPTEELRLIGMSRSIIAQFEQGNVYSTSQVDLLRCQKTNMHEKLDQQLAKEHESWNIPTASAVKNKILAEAEQAESEMRVHPNITMRTGARAAQRASIKLVQKLGNFRKRSQCIPRCTLKCCQTCRPYFKDRAYLSLPAVFADEVDPIDPKEQLPVANVAIVRQLGLRPAGQHPFITVGGSPEESSSSETSCTSCSDSSDSEDYEPASSSRSNFPIQSANFGTALLTPPSSPPPPPTPYVEELRSRSVPHGLYKATRSRSAEREVQKTVNTTQPPTESGGITAGLKRMTRNLAPPWTLSRSKSHSALDDMLSADSPMFVRRSCAQLDEENPAAFDIGLQRSVRSKGSSDLLAAAGLSKAPDGSEENIAPSEEVPVEGGVALTEEAVETHTPDIITQA